MHTDVNSCADNLCVALQLIRQQAPPTALLVQVTGFALQACLHCLQPLSESCLLPAFLLIDHLTYQAAGKKKPNLQADCARVDECAVAHDHASPCEPFDTQSACNCDLFLPAYVTHLGSSIA